MDDVESRITDYVSFDIITKNEDNPLREKYKHHIEDLKAWVAAQENLDIYQISALLYGSQIDGRLKCKDTSFVSVAKSWSVTFIQTSGIIYLIQEQIMQNTQSYAWCRGGYESYNYQYKQFATAFAVYVSLLFYNAICELTSKGMYSWGLHQPCFVSTYSIVSGAVINLFVALLSWVLSIIIMYFNDGVLDMVLNSVALYFLLELDDEAVFFADYQGVATWIETEYDTFIDQYYERYTLPGKQKKFRCCCWWCSENNRCLHGCLRCINITGNKKYNKFVFLPLIVVLPVYIFICV